MKKFLIGAVSLVLVVMITISGVQLVPTLQAINWDSLKGHFTKSEEKFTLFIEAGEGGTVTETKSEYEKGSVIDVSAVPDEGFIFSGWYTENDTYLTTAKDYSFAISENTVLKALFAPVPENMEGYHNYFEELKNCDEDFTFTVVCDRPDAEAYLINNLRIVDSCLLGTEWEDLIKNEFTVERIGDTNEFKISLVEGETYDPGATYTAYIKDPAVDDEGGNEGGEDIGGGNEGGEDIGGNEGGEDVGGGNEGGEDIGGGNEGGEDIGGGNEGGEDIGGGNEGGEDVGGGNEGGEDIGGGNEGGGVEDEYSGSVSFVDGNNESDSMTFTIQKEETEVVEYTQGIIYLYDSENKNEDEVIAVVDDGLAEGEEGDTPDYLILPKSYGIAVNSIICVFYAYDDSGKPAIDDKSFFAKVTVLEGLADGTYKATYSLPALEEIFAELEIYTEGNINIEDQGVAIGDDTVEEIKRSLMCNENFQMYVAAMYKATEDHVKGTEYEVEPIGKVDFVDLFDIKIVPTIKGNKASVSISIAANIPLTKGGKQVAAITFKIGIDKDITVSYGANIQIKYWWFIPTGLSSYNFWTGVNDTETVTMSVSATYDTGSDGLADLEKNVNKELENLKAGKKLYFNKVKDAFKKEGYDVESDMRIQLFTLRYYAGIVTFNFDVSFFLRFDAGVTIKYTSTATENVTYGIRSSSNGAEPYKTVKGNASTANFMIAGKADIRFGIRLDLYVSISGLSKYVRAGIAFEVGGYCILAGCCNITQGAFAGKLERGLYIKAELYYKVFTISGSWDLKEQRWALISYGFDEAIISYANKDINNSTININTSSTKLFNLEALKVNVMDVEEAKTATDKLEIDSNQYKIGVTVNGGEWITYDSKTGEIKVKDGAPLYFEDSITIKVTPNNKRWEAFKKNKVSVSLPTITLNVEYGDEDKYYESIDSKLEHEFRMIYRNYNEGNTKVLKDNFKNLIDNAIDMPEKYSDLFECVSVEYIDQLFDMIKDYRKHEDEVRTMENKFVKSEANAFGELITFMSELIDVKKITAEDTCDILEMTMVSEALYDTLVEVAKSKDCERLAKSFKNLEASTKQLLIDGVEMFEANHSKGNDTGRANKLAKSFYDIIGLKKQ